ICRLIVLSAVEPNDRTMAAFGRGKPRGPRTGSAVRWRLLPCRPVLLHGPAHLLEDLLLLLEGRELGQGVLAQALRRRSEALGFRPQTLDLEQALVDEVPGFLGGPAGIFARGARHLGRSPGAFRGGTGGVPGPARGPRAAAA